MQTHLTPTQESSAQTLQEKELADVKACMHQVIEKVSDAAMNIRRGVDELLDLTRNPPPDLETLAASFETVEASVRRLLGYIMINQYNKDMIGLQTMHLEWAARCCRVASRGEYDGLHLNPPGGRSRIYVEEIALGYSKPKSFNWQAHRAISALFTWMSFFRDQLANDAILKPLATYMEHPDTKTHPLFEKKEA